MLKKEFRDSLRVLLECSLLLLVIPAILLMDVLFFHIHLGFMELLQVILIITVLAFAIYSGLTLFRREEKERSYEYLFSLPLSRSKILVCKILPRLLLVMLLAFIYVILFGIEEDPLFRINDNVLLTVTVFFLSALFLSLAFRNLGVAFIGIYLLLVMYDLSFNFSIDVSWNFLYLRYYNHFDHYAYDILEKFIYILPGLLIVIPLGISFFLTFKRLDLRPPKYRIKPYFYIALPLILVQALLLLLFREDLFKLLTTF